MFNNTLLKSKVVTVLFNGPELTTNIFVTNINITSVTNVAIIIVNAG